MDEWAGVGAGVGGVDKGHRGRREGEEEELGLVGHHPRGRHYCSILANRILALPIIF